MSWLQEAEDYRTKSTDMKFDYDAVEDTKRRRAPTRVVRSEDEHLRGNKRKILTSTARDIRRNFVVARWAIAKHLDFVVDHSIQFRSGDSGLDKTLHEFFDEVSKKDKFDLSGRYSRKRYMRMLEASRLVDGDIFSLRKKGGFLQAIEGDRIMNPPAAIQGGPQYNLDNWVEGVEIDPATGRQTRVAIHSRGKNSSSMTFEGVESMRKVIPHGMYDRFDQVRGIGIMTSVLNQLRDLYESFDYALAKSKVAQLFGLKITRDSDWGFDSDDSDDTDRNDGRQGDSSKDQREISFNKGPQVIDLDPGEDADFLTTNTPGMADQQFWSTMIGLVLKALNIPFCFYDEAYSNFNGNRTALILYQRAVSPWREDVVDFLNDWLCWRLKIGQIQGEISLPSSFDCDPKNWLWLPRGIDYWNPKDEIKADAAAVEAKLTTRTQIRRERYGDDWKTQVLDVLEQESKDIEAAGLNPEEVMATAPTNVLPTESKENKESKDNTEKEGKDVKK